jgi:hypothetical protein
VGTQYQYHIIFFEQGLSAGQEVGDDGGGDGETGEVHYKKIVSGNKNARASGEGGL